MRSEETPVEIKDYLKVLGKRAWLLVMIPAVAGVVAGLIAVQQPQAFRTTATLQLPRDANSSAPALVAQQVADFKAAVGNATVQNKVSKDTGVPVKKIKKLRITQVGESSQLTLGMQDKKQDPSDSKAVILGMATSALNYLQAPDLANGQKAVDAANTNIVSAQQAKDKATNDLNALYTKIGTSDPVGDAKRDAALIDDYTLKLSDATLAGDTNRQSYYEKVIGQKQLHLNLLLGAIPTANGLLSTMANADQDLQSAQTERDDAVKALDQITSSPDLTFSAEGTEVIRKTRVVKTAAAAVVAGFPLAVGIVLLLDAMQRRRQARRAAQSERGGLPEGDGDIDVPAGALPAVLVGSRASPPKVEPEALDNGLAPELPAGEPALLVGAAGAAAAGSEDDPFDGDDLLDGDDEEEELLPEAEILPDEEELLDEEEASLAPAAALAEEDELLEDEEEDVPEAATVPDDDEPDDDEELLDEDDTLDEDEDEALVDAELEDEDLLEDEELLEEGEEEEDDGDEVPAALNGRRGRQPARVPDAEEAFDDDDEGRDAVT